MLTLEVFAGTLVLCAISCCADDVPWWKTAVLYQVYPRSFKDSDGDGTGDLNGIAEKVEYFRDIGVDGIWLSPIFKSPMADNGYDVASFVDIDSIFGTMADFDNLILKMKHLGIKILLDFVPNHTSRDHSWFLSSRNKSDPHHEDYKDFYIWREPSGWNGTTPLPPNNWVCRFNGPAWEWNDDLQMFYLHQFKIEQPDLNYRNPRVVGNMTNVLKFWMDRGVDGFRVDAAKFLFENISLPDLPSVPGTTGQVYDDQVHIYTEDQPETFQLLNTWTEYIWNNDQQDGIHRTMLLEIYDTLSMMMMYYGTGNCSLTMPFNFNLMGVTQESRSSDIKEMITSWMDAMPKEGVSSWVIGNHDNKRVADQCGPDMVDAMNLLSAVLPGIKVSYYGEEIGMQDTFIRGDQTLDPSIFHRDGHRTPMQWDDSPNAGFSTNSSTWLPVNSNYWWVNVEAQRSAQSSHLKVFQAMTKVRKDPVLQRGDLQVLTPDVDTLIIRRCSNSSCYALLINVGSEFRMYTSQSLFTSIKLDMDMEVVVGSINSGLYPGTTLKQGSINLILRPKAAVLLKTVPASPASSAVHIHSQISSFFVVIVLFVAPYLLV